MLRPPVTQRIAIPLKEVGSSVLTSFLPQCLLRPQEEQPATAIDGFFCPHVDPTVTPPTTTGSGSNNSHELIYHSSPVAEMREVRPNTTINSCSRLIQRSTEQNHQISAARQPYIEPSKILLDIRMRVNRVPLQSHRG